MPSVYRFSIFGMVMSSKSFTYLLALYVCCYVLQFYVVLIPFQLAFSQPWSSTLLAGIGLLTGAIYRSDIANLKSFRLPPWLVLFSAKYFLPLVGDLRPLRRTSRALSDEVNEAQDPEPSPITTRRPANEAPSNGEGNASVMREWVNEITGRADRASTGIRIPSEAEITQVMNMFPDVQRDVVVGALQRRCMLLAIIST
jgi:hypothetical protein